MKRLIAIIFFCCFTIAHAQQDKSYVIEADVVEYDNEHNIVTAKGNIEIFRDEYTLKADKITYNQDTKIAYAYGNVTLISPTGDIIKSDYVEIDNVIKEAVANLATACLDKDNNFTAKKVYYHYPNITIFEQVSYTPCPICANKSPMWQVKSSRVKYEKQKHVSYFNNLFELYGVPIFYLPYIMSASPDSPPRSGFLFPSHQKYNPIYGYGIIVPYYLRMGDNKDLLYTPMITTKQGVLHKAKFQHLLEKGSYSLSGDFIRTTQPSVVYVPKDRYHAQGDLNYAFTDHWKTEAKLDRVSDKSYLPNYWDKFPNYLTSNISLSYLNDRNYGSLESYAFQGLRATDADGTDAKLLPALNYHHEFFVPVGKLVFDTNMVNIARDRGTNSRRLSTILGWDKTYYYGYQELTVLPHFRADFYNFEDKYAADSGSFVSNTHKNVVRTLPELELTWKYPLISQYTQNSFYLEPIVNLIFGPNNAKNKDIVNEDSQDVELLDTNLFSTNRYSGFDRVEEGARANYGIIASGIMRGYTEYNLLFGQSYRARKDNDYSVDSGLKDKYFSDYVGRLGLKPHKSTELYYRGRLDSQTYDIRRNEIGVNFDLNTNYQFLDKIHLNANHIHYNYVSQISPSQVHQSLSLNGTLDINKEWYIGGELQRSASKLDSFPVALKYSLGYRGDCATLKISALKDYTRDPSRNITPTNGFSLDLEVHLKNIS